MKFIKTIVLMVVIFFVLGGQAEEISPSNMDDATLLQYALQLQKNQHELFAGAQGVLVTKIVPNSQAEKKGLQRGDIVIAYNGQPMNSVEQLVNSVQANAAKPQVELRLIRAGVVQTVVLQGGRIGIFLKDIMRKKLSHSNPALERLYEEGEKAYYKSDYQIALEKWQTGLQQAREIGDKRYISQFIGNLGVVYDNLGQYQKALDYYQQSLALAREIGDKRGIGVNLTNLGMAYRNLGEYRKALDYYQQALAINREIGNKRRVRNNLTDLGVVYGTLGQYRKALDYFQPALAIDREIGDKRGEGDNLTNLGVAYRNLREYRKALDYYQPALKIQREIGDKGGVGNTLGELGVAYRNLGEHRKALDYFQQALAIFREIGDKQGIGGSLNNLGVVYMIFGQYQKALNYYQQALAIAREIGDKRNIGDSLNNISALHTNLGQYRKALDYLQQALAIAREISDKRGIERNLHNFGVVYDNLGQYRKALDYYQEALEIRGEIGDKRGIGTNLSSLSVVYSKLGQYRKALDYLQQALVIASEIGDKRGIGGNLNNFGTAYTNLGQYQKALDYYQQALAVAQEIGGKREVGESLNNLGVVYENLGQYEDALEYHEKALAIAREIGDKRGIGRNLNNLGLVYTNLGEYRKALDYFQQALAICREIGDKSLEGTNLNNIGVIYKNLGQYRKALDYYQQALAIAGEIGDKRGIGRNLINLGVLYDNLGQYRKALDYLQQALTINRKIGSKGEIISNLINLGSVYNNLGQYEAAITHYEQAINNIEELRGGLKVKEQKLSFMKEKWIVYDEFLALLQMLHKKHPNKSYDRKAIEIFERKQGRIFLEEMGESGARRFAGVPEEISQRDREFEQQIAATLKHRNESLAQGKNAEPHRKRLEKLKVEQADFIEKTLQRDYPAYYALKYPKPVALENLQKDVLQAGELMLIYNVRKENTDLWIVGKQHFSMFNLALTKEQIQQKVAKFREIGIESMLTQIDIAEKGHLANAELEGAVEDSLLEFVKVSHAFYQQLLPKAARELVAKADTLYIIPTEALYKLPFEALVTVPDEEEPHYLIQDCSIAYLSSASLLETLRDANQKRRYTEERQALLAFANPIFPQENCDNGDNSDNGDSFYKSTVKGYIQALLAFAALIFPQENLDNGENSTVRGLRTRAYRNLVGSGGCIPQLPATKDEALNIAKLFNVTPENLYLGEHASRDNLLLLNEDQDLYEFRYVLFATHAVLPNELNYIKQPAVLLSYPEKGGYLTMADVFGLEMNADLVSLSACNTGRGKNVKGEGVKGLSRAFMYAGTPAVSVSLWKVNSQATQQLNQIFFTQLKKKRHLADALRQAKLAVLKGELDEEFEEFEEIYRHPYFWAGFVVFGDGK